MHGLRQQLGEGESGTVDIKDFRISSPRCAKLVERWGSGRFSAAIDLDFPIKDFIPLCGGAFFVTHPANKILVQTFSGVIATYPVGGLPTRMAFDPTRKRLYAAILPSSLVRIDLMTSNVSTLALPLPANRLAMGANGRVVVGLLGDALDQARGVFVDGDSFTLESEFRFEGLCVVSREMNVFAYDAKREALFISPSGVSGGGDVLRRFTRSLDAGAAYSSAPLHQRRFTSSP